jgi:hypothetical protein
VAQVGDIVYLHDKVTKASSKNVMRWCMVVAVNGSRTRVAPRSATVRGLVNTGAELLPEFTSDGWFSRWSLTVPTVAVDNARNIGRLPEPQCSDVLALFTRRRRDP